MNKSSEIRINYKSKKKKKGKNYEKIQEKCNKINIYIPEDYP
jgi:hypothetical protein